MHPSPVEWLLQKNQLNGRRSGFFTCRYWDRCLGNGQDQFQEKAMAIQKSLEAWEKTERLVFASGKVDIHPVIEPQRKKSLIERIKSLLSQAGKEIKEHLETPNTYLTELLLNVSPAL